MAQFEYTEDIEEWLKPMDYSQFWSAMEEHKVSLPRKEHCDRNISSGGVDEKFVLQGLKYIAAIEMSGRFKLHRRPLIMPDLSVNG